MSRTFVSKRYVISLFFNNIENVALKYLVVFFKLISSKVNRKNSELQLQVQLLSAIYLKSF